MDICLKEGLLEGFMKMNCKKKKTKTKNIKFKKEFRAEKIINTKADTIICLKAGQMKKT